MSEQPSEGPYAYQLYNEAEYTWMVISIDPKVLIYSGGEYLGPMEKELARDVTLQLNKTFARSQEGRLREALEKIARMPQSESCIDCGDRIIIAKMALTASPEASQEGEIK